MRITGAERVELRTLLGSVSTWAKPDPDLGDRVVDAVAEEARAEAAAQLHPDAERAARRRPRQCSFECARCSPSSLRPRSHRGPP